MILASLVEGLASQHGSGELIRLPEDSEPHSLSILLGALVQFWLDGSLEPAMDLNPRTYGAGRN